MITKLRDYKFIWLVIVVIIFLWTKVFAQSPEELMKQGNEFYQNEQYQEAISAYNKILSQGFESSSLFYNLGNAYFRTGRLGYAIYNYEKGLKLSPGDEDIAYNLRIANSRTVDRITELPKLFIVQWWDVLLTSFTTTGWSIIAILIYLVFIGSIACYLLLRKIRIQRVSFFVSSISLSLLILSVVILFSRVNRDATTNYGILLESSYSVKVSPDSKSNDAFLIHEGIKFNVEDHVSDWVKIRLIDGKVGWIPRNTLGQI